MARKIILCVSQLIDISKKFCNSDHISAWRSKRLSGKSIKPSAASNSSIAPVLNCINTKSRVKFDARFLKQNKLTFTHEKVVNIYIVYEINLWPFAIAKNFIGVVKLTKNADFDKYNYSGYSIGFEVFCYLIVVGLVKT